MSVLRSLIGAAGAAALLVGAAGAASGEEKPRARDLGIPFTGEPGPNNAITDVAGLTVGYSTIIEGEGPIEVGKGPIRTGVTAILPRGRTFNPVFAGWYSLNGNGEMTGTTWVEESGFLEGPVMITNTHSVGVVRDSVVSWEADNNMMGPFFRDLYWRLPVVAETWDGILNDINGMHVTKEHTYQALDTAASGPIAEGNVGGGTGMNLFNFKGGTGTASRKLSAEDGGYTVGVLVQGNFGTRADLIVAGVPVGREITDLMPDVSWKRDEAGSIIVVVATDAPLLPHQLKRLARRVPLGIAKTGGYGGNGSGDIFIAFSTGNPEAFSREKSTTMEMVSNDNMGPIFHATVDATEEAIINAMVAAETMKGRDDNVSFAIPHDRLQEALRKYNRLQE
ncbi:L-aminopeptidase/D-esterase-like protein [Amaricoccus macauensis]|uniref:L-aminopeptidase/D-esterase-like protein n=1 Tax=Amaricoccus macauensis TaxID=57001 RepID=A0A840SIM3_9RHOB|nr:P1 family peptidase [Amaricoccus macauensis]MBB5220784.1 L-aminopeptidase/D-esterase-like protein [Amaricoccus macauensis]